MARRMIAPLAPGITLQPGYVVRVVALDPTTGDPVAGVEVSGVSMQVDAAGPDDEPIKVDPFHPLYFYAA